MSPTTTLGLHLLRGADVALTEDLSLESRSPRLSSTPKLAFEPVPYEGLRLPNMLYRVKGRHLSIALGLRWWAELW